MTLMSRRYRPNVSQFLALCSRNYHRILLWLPPSDESRWQVSSQVGTLDVKLLESTKYTQLIEVIRPHSGSQFVNQPKVLVRIYHDAQLAEVLTSQQIYRLLPVYHYPNPSMHQPNEKYQINAFLEELLKIGRHDSVTVPTHNNSGK
ncbi:DUF1249 domain-containing protein [Parashewanella spongiae]|uniref:DUF1249 domain-containing protein n=1 Tax=Parashewanella spongiae TaxID=342950 RepID=A0A3A6UJ12_9GAMM|nr:DUF1249 domain-containing protein [Parashewanella spongiae]MCL1078324.1 DUF1249 domain-containing protein [Parashewanella spongiae]RJY17475.1 DUF1249 domain-containing protein [Parashewanella spongiae]